MTVEEPPAAPDLDDALPERPESPDTAGDVGPNAIAERRGEVNPDDDRVPWRVLAIRVVVIVVVLAFGGAVFGALYALAPKLDTAAAEEVRNRVVVFTPRPVPVQRQWRGYGTARALDATNVPARVTATVESVPPRILEGASVRQGELLVQLDEYDFRGEVDRLDAALAEVDAALEQLDTQRRRLEERLELENEDVEIAAAELERVERLTERNVTSAQDVDRAKTLLLAARRARTQTQEQLDAIPPRRSQLVAQQRGLQAQRRVANQNYVRARITAPIAGVLQDVDVEPGESVTAGQRVARIVDPDIIEVPVRLPAAARRSVAVGDAVVLRPTNQPDRAYDAEVSRVAPEDDAQTRTVTVYALLNQEDAPENERLAPGAFVEADVSAGTATPRLAVPRRALRKQRVQAVVEADGAPRIQSIPVEVLFRLRSTLPESGLADDQWAVLADDALPSGTAILATASSSVLDGEPVNPVPLGEDTETQTASASSAPEAPDTPDASEDASPGGVP